MTKKNGTATQKSLIDASRFSNGFDQFEITGITFTGKPRQYRSDCQLGKFKIGSAKTLGRTLSMEVLAFRKFQDEIFGYDFQTWLEVVFIDPANIVAHVLFKTESLDNFDEMVLDLSANKQAIATGIVTAEMVPRSSSATGNSYHAVEFTWKANTAERIEEIRAFAKGLPFEALTIQALEPGE